MTSKKAAAVAAAQDLRVLVGRLRRRMMDATAVGGLTSAQASALARLAITEPTTASVLAGGEKVRPQSMAATVAALAKLGLVRREADPEDGRRQLLFLTAEGREYAQGARASRHEWLARTLADGLTEDELAVVTEAVALLGRVVES
ncbi:DNA-binding transcriptional regulator, MarR family [Amycolatopsis pretoriensis]|uniref:DNA-binding transcriptional regulator, MarR family n=1 Tax=Amycolatopsis pretoriensis TaxID=218821 RepID=A0A1H5Q3Z2_9PSEU|nr:MarR family transcriptional regulator [Amycolatopsis pretoriensis]SEF20755.1 DNA-binding transcriptional regulator, MarR family [Amycolatopsis pretoriensis]